MQGFMHAGQALYWAACPAKGEVLSMDFKEVSSPLNKVYAEDYQNGNATECRWEMETTLEIIVLEQVS